MSPPDPRLERLFGDGAVAFRTAFDLLPDPVGVLQHARNGRFAAYLARPPDSSAARVSVVRSERLGRSAGPFGSASLAIGHASAGAAVPVRWSRTRWNSCVGEKSTYSLSSSASGAWPGAQ